MWFIEDDSTETLQPVDFGYDDDNGKLSMMKERTNSHFNTRGDKPHKSVDFKNVEVREYPVMLGDNPSVSEGCPLTIGWEAQSNAAYDINWYEHLRPTNTRRRRRQLRIPSNTRTKILLRNGHTMEDIAVASIEVSKIKESREARIQNQRFDRFFEAIVMTGHKIKRVASKSQLTSLATAPIRRITSKTQLSDLVQDSNEFIPSSPTSNTRTAMTA